MDKIAVDNDTRARIELGWQNNAYNEYVSDLISVHRSLADLRDEWCRAPGRSLPADKLPHTSVIVCFHNEAWSVLLRSLHSILNRSPPELLTEVETNKYGSVQELRSTFGHLKTFKITQSFV